MKQNIKLSLKEEMDRESRKIEEAIQGNPDLKDLEVSENMEAALRVGIQTYQEKRATEHSKDFEGNVVHLSAEDMEALKLGREFLKGKSGEVVPFEVRTGNHEHNDESTVKKFRMFHMPRKRRVIVALVAVCVLVVGTGVTSVGSKSYLKVLWERVVGEEKAVIMNVEDMKYQATEDGDIINSYQEISKALDVNVVRVKYLPESMNLEKYNIDKEQGQAQLFYLYDGEMLRYSIYTNELDSSLGQKEVDKLTDEFVVANSKQDVKIKEYYVEENQSYRYIADFEYLGMYYQLKGVIDKSEFIEIIKNLTYYA